MYDASIRRAVNVHIVTSNRIHVTRTDILKWLGALLCKELKRVEDLSNGSIYCVVMNQLFPGCIPIHKVKMQTRNESEAIANFKLLSNAFEDLEVKKDIPMESLVKGNFSDNFRFAQWFKLFYDANSQRLPLDEDNYLEQTVDRQRLTSPDIRRSQSAGTKNKWKLNSSSFAGQELANKKRSTHFLTRPSPRSALSRAQASAEHFSQSSTFTSKRNSHLTKKDDDDISDMISEDASDISTSDGYHVPRLGKVDSAWTESVKPDALPSDQPVTPKNQPEPITKAATSTPPNPKKRSQQLPPPSPLPSHQCSTPSTNRFATRAQNEIGPTSPYPQSQLQNLQGSGDRPSPIGSARFNVRTNVTPKQVVPKSSNELSRSEQAKEIVAQESPKRFSSHPPSRFGHRALTRDASILSHPNIAKVESPVPTMREMQINQVLSSEIVSESELQRELAILRYGTIEQRRTLFFCQKEAQFYFKKLLRIESLCQHLECDGDKALKRLVDTIFSILYETEDGFMCPEDVRR